MTQHATMRPHHASPVGQRVRGDDISRENWIHRLEDTRRKWMVMLHRYNSSSSSNKYNGKSSTPPLNTLRHDDAQTAGLDALEYKGNGTHAPHRSVVPAADFCLDCASIVEVELEYSSTGELVAEHRGRCLQCGRDQRSRHAFSTPATVDRAASVRKTNNNLPIPSVQDEATPDRQGRSQFPFRRGSHHVHEPIESSSAGGNPRRTANQLGACSLQAGRPSNILYRKDIRSARRERMLRGLTRSAMHPNQSLVGKQGNNPDPATSEPVFSGAPAPRGGPASSIPLHVHINDPATNVPSIDTGKISMRNGAPHVNVEWAEEIRIKDELISTLKRQLTALGEQPMEEVVTLEEAKKRLREAMDALMAGSTSAEMEQALEKWDKYITNHPDHIKEQAAEEQAWEVNNAPRNKEALCLMKTFVPPDIFRADLDGLRGGGLPPGLAKRIFSRKVLWLVRAPPGMVSKTHVVELKSKFVANDLDIVEARALHSCLPSTFENDADGAKTGWRADFRKRLKDLLAKEAAGQLKPAQVRHPVYEDLAKGPFDPDAAAAEQETTRSGAFDASEKPLVGGKLKPSAIAVIDLGLRTSLRAAPSPLDIMPDLEQGSTGADGMTRSAPNSPASKYRRLSYALSRGEPTTCSMKNMMSELGNRLSQRRHNERRRSSFNGFHDMSQLLRGALDNPVAEQREIRPEGDGDDVSSQDSASEGAIELPQDIVPLLSARQPARPGTAAPPTDRESSDHIKKNPSPAGDGALPSMKGMTAELAAKAKAREKRSVSPSQEPTSEAVTKIEVDPSIVPQPPPPPLISAQLTGQKSSDTIQNPSPARKVAPLSMKDMMTELAAKAKAREERSAHLSPQMSP